MPLLGGYRLLVLEHLGSDTDTDSVEHLVPYRCTKVKGALLQYQFQLLTLKIHDAWISRFKMRAKLRYKTHELT